VSEVGRAFVAVVPPPDVLDAVEDVTATLTGSIDGARRSRREQRHLTLQFLGNRVDLDAVAGALGSIAIACGEARLGGAGAFPSERRGRVLWLGLRDGVALLVQLAGAVNALLRPLGFEPEARPYHPHLTLARFKTPADLREVVGAIGEDAVGPTWTVDEVVLFRSNLRSTGAEYTPFARVPLARSSDRSRR